MKSNVALLLVLAVAALGLWYLGGYVADNAETNEDFVMLYEAAQAARSGKDIYTGGKAALPAPVVRAPAEAETPVEIVDEAETLGEAEDAAEAAVSEESITANAPVALDTEAEDAPTVETETEPAPDFDCRVVFSAEAVAVARPEAEPAPDFDPRVVFSAEAVAVARPEAESRPRVFAYPPFLAIVFIPLTYFKSIGSAALAWYWINVALVFIVVGLAMGTLSGKFAPGRKGMFLVPLLAAVPFLYYFLPTEAVTLLALVFVLGGLALFRRGFDVAAGMVTSIGIFTPVGWTFGLYYLLKRSWKGVLGFLIGVVLLLAVIPMVFFGPRRSYTEIEAYRAKVVSPVVANFADMEDLRCADNQSVWGILTRRASDIAYVGEQTEERLGRDYEITVPKTFGSWSAVVFVVVGVMLVAASLLALLRKLRDRTGPIVGLEGALVITATLILSPRTMLPSMVALIVPLLAMVYVIIHTDLKRMVHHVNYVGLVLATAFFYLSFDPQFRAVGSAFAGAFIVWVAVVAGIGRFKPRLVSGRAAASFAAGTSTKKIKPIDLVKSSGGRKAKKPSDDTILPLPDFAREKTEEETEAPHGMAEAFMDYESPELPTVDVHPGNGDEHEEHKHEDEDDDGDADKDRKIELE